MRRETAFSVSQVNSYIHRIFEGDYALKRIKIRGEVSNCKYHSSGHIYFTLKDDKSALKCIMFSSDRTGGLAFQLENGQSVIAEGNITVYERDGAYQLYARKISLDGTGALYLLYEQRKQELYQKGYFDFERKKPLPAYPRRIGVVTASTGAAIRDIQSVARRRNPYVQLYLYPARVQGEGAAQEIARGIRFFDRAGVDVIIIGRGGGSIEDLWAFNELAVADAIYEAKTPIVSGTGHEIDNTIADYCADQRAATPSAACELVVPDIGVILMQMDQYTDSLQYLMDRKLSQCRQQLAMIRSRLENVRPQKKLHDQRMAAQALAMRLAAAAEGKFHLRQQEYQVLLLKLSALAPTSRLRGGYVFAQTREGRALSSARMLKPGDPLQLIFADGRAEVETLSVDLQEEKEAQPGRKCPEHGTEGGKNQ